MGWNKIGQKYNKRYERDFVSLEKELEKNYLAGIILEEFPNLNKNAIIRAIDQCYSDKKVPTIKTDFLKSLSIRLGV